MMHDQRYADHRYCVTRDRMQQQQCRLLSTCMSNMYVQGSSLQEGEEGVTSELCGPSSGYWLWCKLICCVRHLALHMLHSDNSHTARWFPANLKQATLAHTHRAPRYYYYYKRWWVSSVIIRHWLSKYEIAATRNKTWCDFLSVWWMLPCMWQLHATIITNYLNCMESHFPKVPINKKLSYHRLNALHHVHQR